MFANPLWVYFSLNIMGIIIYSLELKFKLEKPPLSYLKTPMIFWPFLITGFLVWVLHLRNEFAVKVCLCDYQDSVSKTIGRENHAQDFIGTNQYFLKGYPSINDYLCDNKLNLYVNILLTLEISLTLIHFIVVLYHYYYNLLVIKWKPETYVYD